MILKKLLIYSYNSTELIKEYRFKENGLNVILGERKYEGQEANGVGKTTMVESINFLLGGSCPEDFIGNSTISKKDIFLILHISVKGRELYLGRLINKTDWGFICNSNTISYNLDDWIAKESNDDFKEYINEFIFQHKSPEPTLSALREYIIRDEKKGFGDITLPNRNAMYQHMYLAYLFQLPYDYEQQIAKIKKRQKELNKKLNVIRSLKKEIESLKLEEKKIFKKLNNLDEQIKNVELTNKFAEDAEQYKKYKEKYNRLQGRIFDFEHIKKQYIRNIEGLEERLNEIKALNDIEPFWDQLIDYFPSKIKKNYKDIETFYDFMVDNRGKYFKHKIKEIDIELVKVKKELAEIERFMSLYSKSFKNSDIIFDITNINEEKSMLYDDLSKIRGKISIYEEKTQVTSEINKVKGNVLKQIEIKQDAFKNYKMEIETLKSLFNELVSAAYNETGILEFELNNNTGVNDTTGRIKISCRIDDEKSHGRLYMKVNMFDLTWFINGLEKNSKIKFLIHDGSYSKPDKFAKGKLLNYVDSYLDDLGVGQYFITVNKDELSSEVIDQLNNKKSIIAKLQRGNEDKDRFFGFRYTD